MSVSLEVLGGTFHLSGNPIRAKVTSSAIPSGATEYKCLLKITSSDGLLLGGPFIDAVTPASLIAWFDVSGICDQSVAITFEYPLSGGLNPYSGRTLDIVFTPGERYVDSNGNLQESWGSDSATHYVVKGGVGPKRLGDYTDDSSSFYAEFVTGGKFLTFMPQTQVVQPYQPVKLWLLAASSGSASLRIRAVYEDGGEFIYASTHTFYKDIMHEINCNPYHADSGNMPMVVGTTRMQYYEVWIEGVTSRMKFMVDHSHHENCNYLFFHNSIGGIDVVWLNGEVEEGDQIKAVNTMRPQGRTDTGKDETILTQKTGRRTWKINTGWKSKAEMQALRDLLRSEKAWLLFAAPTYNSGELYPVVITNPNPVLHRSQNDMYYLDIDVIEAHESRFV